MRGGTKKQKLTNFLRVGDSNIHIKTVLGLFLLQLCLNKMSTVLNIRNRKAAYINHRVDIPVWRRSTAQTRFVPAPRRWAAWLQGSEWTRRQAGGQRRWGAPSGQNSQTCLCLAPHEPLEEEKTVKKKVKALCLHSHHIYWIKSTETSGFFFCPTNSPKLIDLQIY